MKRNKVPDNTIHPATDALVSNVTSTGLTWTPVGLTVMRYANLERARLSGDISVSSSEFHTSHAVVASLTNVKASGSTIDASAITGGKFLRCAVVATDVSGARFTESSVVVDGVATGCVFIGGTFKGRHKDCKFK